MGPGLEAAWTLDPSFRGCSYRVQLPYEITRDVEVCSLLKINPTKLMLFSSVLEGIMLKLICFIANFGIIRYTEAIIITFLNIFCFIFNLKNYGFASEVELKIIFREKKFSF